MKKKGFEWAMKSAEAGNPRGSAIAALCLVRGIGTASDKQRGMEMLESAAQQGDPMALKIIQNPGSEARVVFTE